MAVACTLPLTEQPIHLVPFILFASQVQEAASRGLKFVGVIPQYHCPVNSAGSNPLVDTRDVRKEPGRDGDHENPGAPKEVDGSPKPSQGPTGEPPTAEQHSLPLEEGNGAEFSPLGVSKTVDGPDGDPSETHEKPLSGSKYVSTRTFDPLKRCFQLFSKPPGILEKRNGISV